jgi:hypothetical protein
MQRRVFLALIGFSGLTARVTGVDLSQEVKRTTTVPKKHPILSPQKQELPPVSADLPRDAPPDTVMEMRFFQMPPRLPPLTLVVSQSNQQVYTRLVNEVTCHFLPGDTEWIGTGYGIKKIDKKRGTVRLYTPEDGLPGGHIFRIVGDEKEAFALVWPTQSSTQVLGSLAFCRLNPMVDQWEVVYMLTPTPLKDYNDDHDYDFSTDGMAQLVLNKDIVAITWGTIFTENPETSLYYIYNRKNKKIQPMPWDVGIQADHRKIVIYFACLKKNKLWLGTSIGLAEMPLKAKKKTTWRRVLPEYSVLTGTASDKTLFMKLVFRKSPQESRLVRMEWETETVKDLPPVPEDVRQIAPSEYALWSNVEETLYCVWPRANLYQDNGYSRSFMVFASADQRVATCLKLLPGASEWVALDAYGKPLPKRAPQSFLPPHFVVPEIASEGELPDAAAAGFIYAPENPVTAQNTYNYHSRMSWLLERFSRWLSPGADESEITPLYNYHRHMTTSIKREIFLPTLFPDPVDEKYVWLIENGDFVRILRQELPEKKSLSQPIFGKTSNEQMLPPITSKNAERFAIDTSKARHYIEARFILPGTTTLVAASGGQAFGLVEGREIAPFALPSTPSSPFSYNTGVHMAFVAGPKKHAFVWEFTQETLARWDEARQVFTTTEIAWKNDKQFLGGTCVGIWRQDSNKTPERLKLDNLGNAIGDWESIPIDFYDEKKGRVQFAFTQCDVLWYRRYTPNDQWEIIGWDDVTQKSTPPIVVTANYSFSVTYGHDEKIYFLHAELERVLQCYDRKASAWSVIGKVPKDPPDPEGRLLMLGNNGIWIITPSCLWRLDQTTLKWSRHTHPLDLRNHSVYGLNIAPSNLNIAWIGHDNGLGGLWKFDSATCKMTEITQSATLPRPLSPAFDVIYVSNKEVWAQQGSLLARLDRKTNKAHLYGLESGLGHTTMQVQPAGGTMVLSSSSKPAQYFDATKNRFEILETGDKNVYPQASTDPQNADEIILVSSLYPHSGLFRWSQESKTVSKIEVKTLIPISRLHTAGNKLYAATISGLYQWDATVSDWKMITPLGMVGFSPDNLSSTAFWANDGMSYIRLQTQK